MVIKRKSDPEKFVSKKRIFIVDDHPLYREGLAQYIESEGEFEVCGEAGNMVDALESIKKTTPDLVTVDVSLGESSGIELVKMIKAQKSEVPLLVLSMHADSLFAELALAAGARGYISKSRATKDILEAIKTILGGKIYLSESVTQLMLEKRSHGISETTSSVNSLSDRELEVYELIGNGKTTNEIALSLHLSSKTIETYRANIKNKMSLRNNTELIQHAVGWVQNGKEK